MNKAVFKHKLYGRGFDSGIVYLFYEYRGHEYMIEVNNARGYSEPLWVQHRRGQSRIDYEIEHENDKPEAPVCDAWDAINEFLDYVG